MAENNDLATVELQCIPDSSYALAGVVNTKQVRFDIETKSKDESQKRTPLNLVLILDRSGSMESDNKLTFAKKAVISVLNLLHDDDIVHLVAYDSSVSIIFENARASTRHQLHNLVDTIDTAGSTNMSGALEVGAGLLEKHIYDGYSRRMFLFSDGQANVGLKTCAELTKLVASYNSKGIITDSFGIGADFDSAIMKGIADSGGARFYFLASSDLIELLVSKALVCVFGVCASHVRLIVRGKNGAIVTKIWGHENLVAGASLGELHSNNIRSVLCEYTCSGAENTEHETLSYELQYNHPSDANGTPVVIKNTLSIKFVEDESLVNKVDPRVKVLYTSQIAADMDKKIAKLVEEGNRKEALDIADQQIRLLRDAQQYDDERGLIKLLLQLSERMQGKLKDRNIDHQVLAQGYAHEAYLKEECDDEDMGFGLFD